MSDCQTHWSLAQLNIAQLLAPIDSPQLKEFVDNLDRINQLAESAPGFVWRLQDENGDATSMDDFGKDKIINMSVWRDVESLHNYVYRSAHVDVMSKRKEWFSRMTQPYHVLWWIPVDTLPTLQDAAEKLELLGKFGSTANAFTFKHSFPQPDTLSINTVF